MSSISALPRTAYETVPESIQDRLRHLASGNRSTHWLTSNLILEPSSATGRFFFSFVIKRANCLRKLFFGIDLEEAKRALIHIARNEIDQRNYSDIKLYRRAIAVFAQYAPNHPIPDIRGYYLDRIHMNFRRNNFVNAIDGFPLALTHIKLLSDNKMVGLPYQVIYKLVKDFEKLGGHVHAIESMGMRQNNIGFVFKKTDDIATVCHAGHVRSKIIKEVIEQKLGINTRETHGILTGYNSILGAQPEGDFQEYFEEAFLKNRTKRFGYGISKDELIAHFSTHYWAKVNPNGRTLFVTFGNAFAPVIEQLMKHHSDLSRFYVIIIPDGDWISHYKPSTYSKEVFADLSKSDERAAQAIISHEYIFLNNPAFERDDHFTREVAKARKQHSNPDAFDDFIMPHVYRYALWYYSNYFNVEQ